MQTVRDIWGRRQGRRREAVGLTQAQLGELVGVSQATVARWEAGKHSAPEAVWPALAEALDTTVELLFPVTAIGSVQLHEVIAAARRATAARGIDDLKSALGDLADVLARVDVDADRFVLC